MKDVFFEIALVTSVIAATALSLFWRIAKSRTILDQWDEANGFRIIEAKHRYFAKGPYFWGSGRRQAVYQVIIEDAGGQMRRGWIRIGGLFVGLLSAEVDVQWDAGFPLIVLGGKEPPDAVRGATQH